MRARICDNCHVIIRGPYHKVIGIGSSRGKALDLCPKCVSSLYPMEAPKKKKQEEPKTRRLYDVPLDDSPIRVHEVKYSQNMNADEVDQILNSGDYPPNPSPK